VYELGSTAFDKRAKKVLQTEKIIAFGGKAPKNPKMPLKMLRGIRQAEKKRAERAVAEQRESGIVVAHQKLDNVLRPLGKSTKKRRKRQSDIPVDALSDGVLRLKHPPSTSQKADRAPKSNKKRRR